MKGQLKIGEFSKITGLSPKALRIYDELGLLVPASTSESGYRIYSRDQLLQAEQIKQFKAMGFELKDIFSLIKSDLDDEKIESMFIARLEQIRGLKSDLLTQEKEVHKIISSLKQSSKQLDANHRRYIMSKLKSVSFAVTGINDLEETAKCLQSILSSEMESFQIFQWNEKLVLPESKPYIIVVPEDSLSDPGVSKISPDVVIIRDISKFDNDIEKAYLSLYSDAGPHMTTVFNADDRLSVSLAANTEIRKGRTFYHTKNVGLEDQIRRIGGVVSDGEEIQIFGFNLKKEVLKRPINNFFAFRDEINFLASLTSVIDVGVEPSDLQYPC